MQARVTRTTASLGSTMVASGTFSTRTSFLPYMMVARMACLSSWCKAQELSGARRSVRAQQGPSPIEVPDSRGADHSEKKGHFVRHARESSFVSIPAPCVGPPMTSPAVLLVADLLHPSD